MQQNRESSFPWISESNPDFPLGAKATSCLPSATYVEDDDYKRDMFELPDWMESRENLGLSNIDLLDEIKFPENDFTYQVNGGITDMEEDYSQTINPEDMLVPLSELEPETYTPQGIGATTLSEVSNVPKVLIRVSKVQVPIPEQQGTLLPVQQPQDYLYPKIQSNEVEPFGNATNYNTDALLNELVEMATNEPNGLSNLISSFDSSVVQAGMDDLLSQLESCEPIPVVTDVSNFLSQLESCELKPVATDVSNLLSQLESCEPKPVVTDVSAWSPEPASPVSLPSPVPSMGSLSPLSTGDTTLHQTPTYTIDDKTIQPEYCRPTFLSLLSPCTDDSVSVQSHSEDEESEQEESKREMHSYSRSARKSKSSRKASSSRGTPYPESRKERKKEQNKQAALRYRHKKKQEDDVLMTKIEEEEERQKKLKAKYTNLKQELTYLKKIMREVLIAKGTLSPEAFKKK